MSIFVFTFRKYRKVFFFQSKKKWKQGYCFGSNEPWLFLIGFYFLIILIENSLKWKNVLLYYQKDRKLGCYFDSNGLLAVFDFFVASFLFEKTY